MATFPSTPAIVSAATPLAVREPSPKAVARGAVLPPADAVAGSRADAMRRARIACLCLAFLLPSLSTSIANVALPTLASSFGASFQAVQWVVLAYLLAVTPLIVGAGRLGDLYGRRRLMIAGIGVFAAGSLACGVSPTLPMLVLARGVQGIGAAAMMALAMAFVSEIVPREKTGSAMGLLGTMSAVGTALGPSLGGLLIVGFGWRSIFFVLTVPSLLALRLAYRLLPEDGPRDAGRTGSAGEAADGAKAQTGSPRARFDVVGTALLTATLAAYSLALTYGAGRPGSASALLLAMAIAGGIAFFRYEARQAAPLIRATLLREPAMRAGLATTAIVSAVLMTTLVVGPFYLSRALGFAPGAVGLVLSVGPVISALIGYPAGRFVDRLGVRFMTMAGLAAIAVGCLALSLLPASLGVAGYLAPIALLTTGYAVFQAANNTAVMAGVAADERGLVSGLLNLARNLGLITGTAAMGAVFAVSAQTASLSAAAPTAVEHAMHRTFAVATALIIVAIVAAKRAPTNATPGGVARTRPAERKTAPTN